MNNDEAVAALTLEIDDVMESRDDDVITLTADDVDRLPVLGIITFSLSVILSTLFTSPSRHKTERKQLKYVIEIANIMLWTVEIGLEIRL